MTAAPDPLDEPGDLTPEWMTAALRAAGFDTEVTGVEATPIGTGQMSVSLRVRYQVTRRPPSLPTTLVVKIPTPDRRMRPLVRRGYRAEMTFYTDVAPTVSVDAPNCHLAVADAATTSFTLVLEDLSPAVQGDQISGAPVEVIEAAVANLAGLHGPRWCDPALWSHPGILPSDPAAGVTLAEGVAAAIPRLAERLGPAMSPEDRSTLELSAVALASFLAARPPRHGLIHGDYRLDNLLFAPGGRVSAVDWQTLTVGLPARDLAYLLGTCLSVPDRRTAEGHLVKAYREQLGRHGVTGYVAADCFDDYRLGMLQCPLIIVLGAAYALPTERGDAMFATMITRSCQAIRDLESFDLAKTG